MACAIKELHDSLKDIYTQRSGELIDAVTMGDTENLSGRGVVAGKGRRSAALAIGAYDDTEYLEMKNLQQKLYHQQQMGK